jgi:hypothetical protein
MAGYGSTSFKSSGDKPDRREQAKTLVKHARREIFSEATLTCVILNARLG